MDTKSYSVAVTVQDERDVSLPLVSIHTFIVSIYIVAMNDCAI